MVKKSIIALLVILAVMLSSCDSNAGPAAMSLETGGRMFEFSTNVYSYYLSSTKTRQLINMYAAVGISLEQMRDIPELWDDEETAAEVKEQAEFTMKQMLAIVAYCHERNLTLSAEQRDGIDRFINELINEAFGRSRTNFNNTLARFMINENIFREMQRYELMAGLVYSHLFEAETGTRIIQPEVILAAYEANFARFKHIVIMTETNERGVDGELIELTVEQRAEIRAGAQDIYNQITESGNDADLFERLMAQRSADTQQIMLLQGYTVNEMSGLNEDLTSALFDMEIGGVSMVETDGSIHIMRRYGLLPPDQTPDLSNQGNSIAQTMERSLRSLIVFEELAPYIENITVNTEEIASFSVKAADTMFDIWAWIGG